MASAEAPRAEFLSHFPSHNHIFLGDGHDGAEGRTWAVIWLCGAMMAIEIAGGLFFGSIALVADGLHMSTHAGALLLSALAYRYARKWSKDARFTFGTGKMGDLAGFSSAIILAMISLLIAYEAASRLFAPVPIHFNEALPIAFLGLAINIGSVWLLSAGGHHHHGHAHAGDDHDHDHDHDHGAATGRDNNMRAAVVHVAADAAVSVLVIVGLLLARGLGWLWMDPLAGIIGAIVIASWSYGLLRDTGAILLDMNPDRRLADRIRHTIESDGDTLSDLHLWRLGPGHLGAIVAVATRSDRGQDHYRARLGACGVLSHLTVQVEKG